MVKKHMGGDRPKPEPPREIDLGDFAAEMFDDPDKLAAAEFAQPPWNFSVGDDVTFWFNGSEIKGKVSFFRAIRPIGNSYGQRAESVMYIQSSQAGTIPQIDCSMEDLKANRYKIVKLNSPLVIEEKFAHSDSEAARIKEFLRGLKKINEEGRAEFKSAGLELEIGNKVRVSPRQPALRGGEGVVKGFFIHHKTKDGKNIYGVVIIDINDINKGGDDLQFYWRIPLEAALGGVVEKID